MEPVDRFITPGWPKYPEPDFNMSVLMDWLESIPEYTTQNLVDNLFDNHDYRYLVLITLTFLCVMFSVIFIARKIPTFGWGLEPSPNNVR